MNIVLMAGGGGTRLWPLSRRSTPKQFLDLGTGKTLIEHVYDRALQLTDANNIFVATSEAYHANIKQLLPQIPDDHVFLEPEKRDTMAAFATIALRLQALGKGDEATMHMWSDHVFTNEQAFIDDLKLIPGLVAAHPESLIIVGHTPVSPDTTLGYMELAEAVGDSGSVNVVKQFVEKPDAATAEKYVAAGNFRWNLGYFSARPNYILEELTTHNPELAEPIAGFADALKGGSPDELAKAYSQFPKIAIDYALMEKTPRIIAITGDYGWSDVGNWGIIKDIFGQDGDHMPAGHHVHVDSKDNYIYNTTDKTVSLIGQENTIVVVTDDSILITDRDSAPKVKDVVAQLEEAGRDDVL